MAGQPGYVSKLDIKVAGTSTWVPYACSTITWDDGCQSNDVSNTEGVPGGASAVANARFGAKAPGQNNGRVSFASPAFDINAGEFAAPLLAAAGIYYAVRYYPAGRGAGLIMHEFHSLLCTRVGQNMGSPSNPVPTSWEFETDGQYSLGAIQA
jgi:hypothetical protein